MALLEGVEPEEALASLASVKARIYFRQMRQAGMAPAQEGLGQYYTVREVAALLGTSEKFVRGHQGQLRAVKVGRSVRIPEAGVRTFLAST